jgi:3-phenylpropionate/trans-cinnamate dioxygenase ferredoxin reductase subunit
MRELYDVSVNGELFSAAHGDALLEAALRNGIDIPHDCRSEKCGTCRVRIMDGELEGIPDGEPNVMRACQCRIVSNVAIAFEETPQVCARNGVVHELNWLSSDVVEVCIKPSRPLRYLPGQYLHVQFRGFPERSCSPTVALELPDGGKFIRFHVHRSPNGQVSSALGRQISVGHRVRLTGPFGTAYLRTGLSNRLVLVSGGTGFAPIWATADAALRENANRMIVAIVGARSLAALYMIPALCELATGASAKLVAVIEERNSASSVIESGRPADLLPQLKADDIVHAAGEPETVEGVLQATGAAGVICHANAFQPAQAGTTSWIAPAATWDGLPATISRGPSRCRDADVVGGAGADTSHACRKVFLLRF